MKLGDLENIVSEHSGLILRHRLLFQLLHWSIPRLQRQQSVSEPHLFLGQREKYPHYLDWHLCRIMFPCCYLNKALEEPYSLYPPKHFVLVIVPNQREPYILPYTELVHFKWRNHWMVLFIFWNVDIFVVSLKATSQILNFVNELTNEPYTVVYDSDKNFVIAFKSFLSTKNISLHFIEIDPNQIVNDNELYDQTFGFLAFRDEETNSTWNLLGSAVRGPLKGIFSFMHFKNNYILICPLLLIYSCLCWFVLLFSLSTNWILFFWFEGEALPRLSAFTSYWFVAISLFPNATILKQGSFIRYVVFDCPTPSSDSEECLVHCNDLIRVAAFNEVPSLDNPKYHSLTFHKQLNFDHFVVYLI